MMELLNYVGGAFVRSKAAQRIDIVNPATARAIAAMPLTPPPEVDAAVAAARSAWPGWRRTPAVERARFLFRLRALLVEHQAELARTVTEECGKTLRESMGEVLRGIENVEVACGIPSLLLGDFSEDVAPGIDEFLIRQPVGVVAAITPFNFPAMIPLWFLPYAIACGNTFLLKPSEKTPITAQKIFELIHIAEFPPGVVNLLQGSKETVDALLDHPDVRAVSFVGSTPVAKYVYTRATSRGKRAQCQGGAKNPIVILPDADMAGAARIVSESAFGCAGQRCLAGSVAVTVGESRRSFSEAIATEASAWKIGCGLEEGVQMGPVIRDESRQRIVGLIDRGLAEGARAVLDGRRAAVAGYESGFFLGPTLLEDLPADASLLRTEVFGPVLGLVPLTDIDEAIAFVNRNAYGNMACLFTRSGEAARKFRSEAQAGNIGINIGVAAPIAFFPFSGWKESFFGDLHGQGRDAIDFYTEKKIVIERWG